MSDLEERLKRIQKSGERMEKATQEFLDKVRETDEASESCEWELHNGAHKDWHPGCTSGVCFKEGHGPDDVVKPWIFCPYCGKPLAVKDDHVERKVNDE